MKRKRNLKLILILAFAVFTISVGLGLTFAQGNGNGNGNANGIDNGNGNANGKDPASIKARMKYKSELPQKRQAAADKLKANRKPGQPGPTPINSTPSATAASVVLPLAGTQPDYYGGITPNWAWTPIVPKFVNRLPQLAPLTGTVVTPGGDPAGQYLTVAIPDTVTYPGTDYYEIMLVQFKEQMHTNLPPTTLQGYVQVSTSVVPGAQIPLFYLDGITPILMPDGITQAKGVTYPHYLGGNIIARKDRPVRIKFTNKLPTGMGGNLFIPVDTTDMGAGMGANMVMPMTVTAMGTMVTITYPNPLPTGFTPFKVGEMVMLNGFVPQDYNDVEGMVQNPTATGCDVMLKTAPATSPPTVIGNVTAMFTENRATLHLHGGATPWISDGTPHQWTTPAGESTSYPKGVSVKNVSDMPDPGDGSLTFYYTNQQSARLMFYHDHAWGITRLNVYAGEATGYLVTDQAEQDLITAKILPNIGLPLIIQDKTFVDAGTLPKTDPTWNWGTIIGSANTGDLWYPHVYMPNQNPNDLLGVNPMGRWDYGPFFWPPWPVKHQPITVGGLLIPNLPIPSMTMEAYHDTPVVNGTVYPYMPVDPCTYRFRILNAANDRMFNLQLYVASSIVDSIVFNPLTNGGSGYTTVPTVTITPAAGDITGYGATALATIDPVAGTVTSVTLVSVGSGYTAVPTVTIAPPTLGVQATATATIYTALTEVGMVPAVPGAASFPMGWTIQTLGQPGDILDNRAGGVPDPRNIGPSMIQVGTEGGFLPTPVIWPNTPVGFERNPKDIIVGNVKEHNLFLGPAERADVLIDFSAFAGKTIIMYNDAGAAVPAPDSRLDYYTADANQTSVGGRTSTLAGFGPNTRTVMQFRVGLTRSDAGPITAYNLAALQAAFASTPTTPGVFAKSQEPIIVPQGTSTQRTNNFIPGYNTAYGATFPAGLTAYSRIQSTSLTFNPLNLVTPSPTVGDLVTTAITQPFLPKAIQELFENDYGRMNATLGVELKFTNGTNQTTIPYGYVDPVTEVINNTPDIFTVPVGTAGDGTQIWKITHNGVDTHPIHFHLFNVQMLNRVGWDGAIRPPEENELGWKETLRMNPLEDCIVAFRATAPKQPFGLPESSRPLNPMMPLGTVGAAAGFFGVDPNGNPITVTNKVVNFGWEYVWHCHILSHEEMDMMRPVRFKMASLLAAAPVLTLTGPSVATLTWTDGTPFDYTSWTPTTTIGNPASEIGFRIDRSVNGAPWAALVSLPANVNPLSYIDSTMNALNWNMYRVDAYNAAGDSFSNIGQLGYAVYEAETATLGGPSGGPLISSVYPGYTGTGYVDYQHGTGDYIQWSNVMAPSAGQYMLKFRYALISGNRPLSVTVNGVVVVTSQSFPSTGSWSTWKTVAVAANLNAGNNTVRITTIGLNGADVDHMEVSAYIPDAILYEAESPPSLYSATGVQNSTAVAGYTGTGFADYTANTGAWIEWTVNAPAAGSYNIQFRYGLASGSRPLAVAVNGVTVIASQPFPSTGAWTNWRYSGAVVNLNAGVNTIRTTTIGSNGGNMDHLIITAN